MSQTNDIISSEYYSHDILQPIDSIGTGIYHLKLSIKKKFICKKVLSKLMEVEKHIFEFNADSDIALLEKIVLVYTKASVQFLKFIEEHHTENDYIKMKSRMMQKLNTLLNLNLKFETILKIQELLN
jgi:hypothetical protein